MAKNSCIKRIEDDSFIIIRESYISICEGNDCAAALMNWYEHRYNQLMGVLEDKKSNNARYKESIADYLIQSSNDHLRGKLLNHYGKGSVITANALMAELKFIQIVDNVSNPNGGSPVNHILFNAAAINAALDEYLAPSKNGHSIKKHRPKTDTAPSKNGHCTVQKRTLTPSKNGHTNNSIEDSIEDIEDSPSTIVEAVLEINQVETEKTKKDAPAPAPSSFENETKAVGKEGKHLHQQFIDIYDQFHTKEVSGEKFIWDGKSISAITALRMKIIKVTDLKLQNATDENYLDSLKFFISQGFIKGDRFLKNNFSPCLINSKFNEIITNIKNNELSNNSNRGTSKITAAIDQFIASTHH